MHVCRYINIFIYFILHISLLVVILHAFFHIYNYCTMFINTYNYCYILRRFGFFNVASNFVKRKCVYKFNKKLGVSLLIVFYLLAIYLFFSTLEIRLSLSLFIISQLYNIWSIVCSLLYKVVQI